MYVSLIYTLTSRLPPLLTQLLRSRFVNAKSEWAMFRPPTGFIINKQMECKWTLCQVEQDYDLSWQYSETISQVFYYLFSLLINKSDVHGTSAVWSMEESLYVNKSIQKTIIDRYDFWHKFQIHTINHSCNEKNCYTVVALRNFNIMNNVPV